MATTLRPIRTQVDSEQRIAGEDRLAGTVTWLHEMARANVDARVHSELLTMRVTPDTGFVPNPIDRVQLVAKHPQGEIVLRVSDHAHGQLSDKLGIDRRYWTRMLQDAPDLACTNANHWLENEPERRLLRMRKPVSRDESEAFGGLGARMQLRAFLGEKYRTVDHYDLVMAALPAVQQAGAWLTEHHVNETHLRLRFVTAGHDVFERLRAEGTSAAAALNAAGLQVNEMVRMGFALTNSEVGAGSIVVEPWAEVVRCMNGMITATPMRQRHVGKRKAEEDAWLAQDTRSLDDATFLLKVRDRITDAMSDNARKRAAHLIVAAANAEVELPDDTPTFEFVENVGRKMELNDREVRMFADEVNTELHTSTAQRGLTRWAISQGMTATARNLKRDRQFERAVELERAGFEILTSTTEKLAKWGASREE